MRKSDGIRSYGPGKFYTILDSYVFEMSLDGGADEEASYEEGGGWYGLVRLGKHDLKRLREIAAEHRDKLTREEVKQVRDHVGVILFERSDGIVESDWFDSDRKLDRAWARIEEDVYSEEAADY